MTWEQMFAAICAVSPDAALRMRKPGDWYVESSMSIGGDGFSTGAYGNGRTPQEAIENHWSQFSELKPPLYAICGLGPVEQRVRWNGFMWAVAKINHPPASSQEKPE